MDDTKMMIGLSVVIVLLLALLSQYDYFTNTRRIANLPLDDIYSESGHMAENSTKLATLVVNANLPSDTHLAVYRLLPLDDPEGKFIEFANQANISSKPFVRTGCTTDERPCSEYQARTNTESPGGWTEDDYMVRFYPEKRQFEIWRSSNFYTPDYSEDPRAFFANPPKTITKEQAIKISKDYLEARGWLPPESEYDHPRVNYNKRSTIDNVTRQRLEANWSVSVGFGRLVDGISSEGGISLHLTINGTIQEVDITWPPLDQYAKAGLIPSSEVAQKLVSGDLQGAWPPPYGEMFNITDVHLYYRRISDKDQSYMIPYWSFGGELKVRGRTSKSGLYVPAIKRS